MTMKTLYSLRPSDARIMRYHDVWSELGTIEGLATPRLGSEMAACWFKFIGKLWCAVLAEKKVIVARFENNNLKPVAELPTSILHAAWGNAINYAGNICWLEQNETNSILYSFNGVHLISQVVDIPQAKAFSQLGSELTLTLLGNQLAVLPRALRVDAMEREPHAIVRNTICLLDLKQDGIKVTKISSDEIEGLNAVIPSSPGLAAAELGDSFVGAGVYRDRIIALYTDAKIGRLNESNRTVLADVSSEAFMKLGRYATTADGSAVAQVIVGLRQLALDASPFLLGARCMVGSGPHAGISGIVVSVAGNDSLALQISSDTPRPFPALLANTEISFGRGVAGGFGNETRCPATPGPLVHSFFFEVADALYGFIFGRSHLLPLKPGKQAQPSFLARIRGDAVVLTELKLDGQPLNVWSAQALLDYTDSSVHVLAYDAEAKAVRHLRYGVASMTLSDQGVAYTSPEPTHLAAGNLIAFDTGELDIVLGSIELSGTNVKVNYGAYGDNPSESVVALLYNVGNGWKPATLTSETRFGLLVHALGTDQPGFNGEIQYRADISRS